MSLRPSTCAPRICSGDMYSGVPTTDARDGGRRVQQPGDAEVGQDDPPVVAEQDVRLLDVAMDELVAMGEVERRGDAADDPLDLGERDRLRQPLLECGPVDVLQNQVGQTVLLAVIVDRDDVRMAAESGGDRAPRG